MSSFWSTFQNAGWVSFAILLVAMATFTLGLVNIIGALAAGKSRAWLWVASVGLLLGGLGMTLGGGGTWYLRRKVDAALLGADLDWTDAERIYIEGFSEARDASVVALWLLAVPLSMVCLAAVLSGLRARTASGDRPKTDLIVVISTGAFALLGTVASFAGLRSGDDAARAHAVARMKSSLSPRLADTDCSVCGPLGDAVAWRGAAQIEDDLPGARDRARKCIGDWLADVDAGKWHRGKPCRSSSSVVPRPAVEEPPDRPETNDTGADPGADAGVPSEESARARPSRGGRVRHDRPAGSCP